MDAASVGARASTDAATQSADDLLERAGGGDEAAFAELYDLVSPRLHGLVLRVLRDQAQSEEVTQEVFVEIWRTSPRFERTRGSALSWMLTIAHRRAVDRVRASQSAREREHRYGAARHEVAFDSTAESVLGRAEATTVREALGGLTDHQRQALTLAYLDGHTHTEVADILGLPVGTAKSRIRDGLLRLRRTLGVER